MDRQQGNFVSIALGVITAVQLCVIAAMADGWHPWSQKDVEPPVKVTSGNPTAATSTQTPPTAVSGANAANPNVQVKSQVNTQETDPLLAKEVDGAAVWQSQAESFEAQLDKELEKEKNLSFGLGWTRIKLVDISDTDMCKDKLKKAISMKSIQYYSESANALFIRNDDGTQGWIYCDLEARKVYYGSASVDGAAGKILRTAILNAVGPAMLP